MISSIMSSIQKARQMARITLPFTELRVGPNIDYGCIEHAIQCCDIGMRCLLEFFEILGNPCPNMIDPGIN